MNIDKAIMKASLYDTAVGFTMNLPIALVATWLGLKVFKFEVAELAIFQTIIFTVVAIGRKYVMFKYFGGKI